MAMGKLGVPDMGRLGVPNIGRVHYHIIYMYLGTLHDFINELYFRHLIIKIMYVLHI